MIDNQKTALFEQMPVPKAVMKLAVPTILSSLVMVIYNLADTYFVGMMNNPVQNAVQAFLSVKSAGPNVEKVEKLLAKPKKRTHPSVDRK